MSNVLPMAERQQRVIIILVAVLIAAAVVAGILWWMLPGEPAVQQDLTQTQARPGGGFDLGVFNRSGYTAIDQRLIREGALPVQPPAGTGKANPFL